MKNTNEFSTNWKTYLSGTLNKRIIHFLDEWFIINNIFAPSIQNITEITDDELLQSWLSLKSCKELMLFQQDVKKLINN